VKWGWVQGRGTRCYITQKRQLSKGVYETGGVKSPRGDHGEEGSVWGNRGKSPAGAESGGTEERGESSVSVREIEESCSLREKGGVIPAEKVERYSEEKKN